jgi:hypothetical protein
MLDRCPTCGRTTGTLMEMHPDKPGLMDMLTDENQLVRRVVATIAVCLLATLAVAATITVFA